MNHPPEIDIEKGVYPEKSPEVSSAHGSGDVVPTTFIQIEDIDRSTAWGKFMYASRRLEAKLGIEARGIERVPSNARTDTRVAGNTDIWLAANCVLSTFGIGILGPLLFELGLGDSMLIVFFANVLTACLPSMMATFGPKLGLRQMTSTRFSWGWYGAKIVAVLNCIACVGWSTINTIAGAQVLVQVADGGISSAVGVVIIAICTLLIGFFGYKVVHHYERWSWIPTAICFIIMLGVAAKHLVNTPMGVGSGEAANCLSFFGTCFGFTVGWVSLASDYNVYLPEETPAYKIFGWTYLGLIIPLVLVEWLGVAIAAAATDAITNPTWAAGYADEELGGLIGAVLIPPLHNFGKFLMVLLVLSVVANNIINVYSMGMSISVVGSWFAATPRWIWPLVVTGIYIPLAIVGAHSFSSSLENFMNVLGYWLAIYVVVVLEEHFIFRKGKWANYDVVNSWNRKSQLPIGLGAIAAGCIGVMMAVLFMSQVWFEGPASIAIDPTAFYSPDLGFEFAALGTGVTYPLFRYLERKFIGR